MEAIYRGHPGRVITHIWHEVTGETALAMFAYQGEGHWTSWDRIVVLRGADLEGLVINGKGVKAATDASAGSRSTG
jgi:hypothetical protein